jgi:predicted acylesterase/phospholipase RssA
MPLGRVGNAAYWDGGLMLPLPLWAAIEMGATRIVAVNLLPARPPLIEAFARGLRWYCRWNGAAAGAELIEIAPSGRLGKMRHSVYWSRDNAERWIARGRADAQRAKSNISL